MTYAVYLTTPGLSRLRIEVDKTARGVYAIRSAEGIDDLDAHDLGFDLSEAPAEFVNHDYKSDAMSCFQRSTNFVGPELTVIPGEFHSPNLDTLQRNLDKLRGDFISNQEY